MDDRKAPAMMSATVHFRVDHSFAWDAAASACFSRSASRTARACSASLSEAISVIPAVTVSAMR